MIREEERPLGDRARCLRPNLEQPLLVVQQKERGEVLPPVLGKTSLLLRRKRDLAEVMVRALQEPRLEQKVLGLPRETPEKRPLGQCVAHPVPLRLV